MTQNIGYDAMSRLTSVFSSAANEALQYDVNGNRISQVLNGASATIATSATSNQVLSLSGAANTTYGYDAKGNMTTVSGTTTFAYDAFNRLSSAGTATYYVGAEGQRLRKTISGANTYFAPDISGPLMAENPGSGWNDYVWLNGRLIGRIVSGQLQAIHDDQVGRPEVITDPGQSIVWRARNYAFDRTVTVANVVPLNLGFPGQYYDAESGLWSNGFRDYSPSLGRYIESDPIGLGGGINTYAYVGSSPLSATDLLGLAAALSKCGTAAWIQQAVGSGDDPWSYLNNARRNGRDVGDSNLVAAERYFDGYNGNYNTVLLSLDTALKYVREIAPVTTRIFGKNGSPASDGPMINYYGQLGIDDAGSGKPPGSTPLDLATNCSCGS